MRNWEFPPLLPLGNFGFRISDFGFSTHAPLLLARASDLEVALTSTRFPRGTTLSETSTTSKQAEGGRNSKLKTQNLKLMWGWVGGIPNSEFLIPNVAKPQPKFRRLAVSSWPLAVSSGRVRCPACEPGRQMAVRLRICCG